MKLSDYLLMEPRYKWADENGNFIKPTLGQIFSEYFYRINIFRDKRNWFPLYAWLLVLLLMPAFLLLITKYLSIGNALIAFIYGMVIMGSHGTMWYHRYSTHSAFTFKNKFWKFISQHLVIKVIPEELYVVSHHIHHEKSDKPGDPYNAFGGFFYCFLADTNHQLMNRELSEEDYNVAKKNIAHTGSRINTYEQYLKYGTIAHPLYILLSTFLNWAFWGTVFYFLGEWVGNTGGGIGMLCAIFGGTFLWAVGVRTFNYEGHGKGKGKKGWGDSDYNRSDYSINQVWAGYVAGEWHNNHHLFATSARSGFLPYQLDLPWLYVQLLYKLGGVTEFRDNKKQFMEKYVEPFKIEHKYIESSALPPDISGV
jgi:fatty-acid desaturase